MVTIRVTGHRFLAERDRLDDAHAAVVERLAHARPGPWTTPSSLAEGADRLIARHLLGRPGSRLVAVLPLEVDDHGTDFLTPESRAEFRELRDLAHEAAGRVVVDRSHVLGAMWDAQDCHGVGGTGEIVQLTRDRDQGLVTGERWA